MSATAEGNLKGVNSKIFQFSFKNIISSKTFSLLTAFSFLFFILYFGQLLARSRAPYSFGFGDITLFHAFGHWIANGEYYIRDFIHFRTPGPYYYYAIAQSYFGSSYLTTSTALLLEAFVWQAAASFTLTLAVTRVFWGRASPLVALSVAFCILLLSPIFQLRTALPVFAIAFYIFSFSFESNRIKSALLFLAGVIAGISYWFGQEIFIFVVIAVGAAELSLQTISTVRLKRGLIIIFGTTCTIVPVLVAMSAENVSIKEFFYYTFYYAFVIQPKGMDLPFPKFRIGNLIYYNWFFVLIFSTSIFAYVKQIRHPVSVLVVTYASLRMISALGRADYPHLLFSVSEVFVLLPLGIVAGINAFSLEFDREQMRKSVKLGLCLLLVFYIGIKGHASILLSVPVILLAFNYLAEKNEFSYISDCRIPFAGWSITIVPAILTFLTIIAFGYPNSWNTLRSLPDLKVDSPTDTTLGVRLQPAATLQVEKVKKIIENYNVDNIFTYPLRTEYYAFVKHHGARFIEFAPQTTQKNIFDAIADLKKSRPGLVIRDLDQLAAMSPMLHELSDYIMSNYRPITVSLDDNKLEILELLEKPSPLRRLYDQVYMLNTNRTDVTAGVRPTVNGRTSPVIAINHGLAKFKFSPGTENVLRLQVYPEPNCSLFGTVEINYEGKKDVVAIKADDNVVEIPLPSSASGWAITLRSAEFGRAIVWQDPYILRTAAAENKKLN